MSFLDSKSFFPIRITSGYKIPIKSQFFAGQSQLTLDWYVKFSSFIIFAKNKIHEYCVKGKFLIAKTY